MQTKFEPSELYLAIKNLDRSKNLPKFILWLIHDSKYGLLQNTFDIIIFNSIKSKVPLYEEWLNTGEKPSRVDDFIRTKLNNNNNRFKITNIIDALDAGCYDYISRYAIRNKVSNGGSINFLYFKKDAINAQLNKIKELINEDGLFTEQDYETT